MTHYSLSPDQLALRALRVEECLLAGALGDAFGYAIEFDSWERIVSTHGPQGLVEPPFRKNSLLIASDDTQMTLFAAEALARALKAGQIGPVDLASHAREAFLDWYGTQRPRPLESSKTAAGQLASDPVFWAARAPGNTCLSALSRGGDGSPSAPLNDSKGCGAVMRAFPWGALAPLLDFDEIWQASALQGALTHGHPDGYQSGAALSCLIARQLSGEDLLPAARATLAQAQALGAEGTSRALHLAIHHRDEALSPAELTSTLGEGWVGEEALSVALWSALRASSVMQAIRLAANHSGDSDSTASIAGQIAAASFGLSLQERDWALKTDLAPACLRVSQAFNSTFEARLASLNAACAKSHNGI